MILTKEEILKEIKAKRVKITPMSTKDIGPASIDLTLDSTIRVFLDGQGIVELHPDSDYRTVTKVINIRKGYILKPGELVLGITKEKVTLPPNICGWLQSRSRFARFGVMSHISAPFIAPGVSNKQVLEIFNAGPLPIKLLPGQRFCHLILQDCRGNATYKGKFRKQRL